MGKNRFLRRSNTFVKDDKEVNAAEDIATVVRDVSETSCSSTSTSPGSSQTTTPMGESSESVTSSSEAVSPHEVGSTTESEPHVRESSEEVKEHDSILGSIDGAATDSTRKLGLAEVPFSTPSTPRCSIPQPSPQDISNSRKETSLLEDINNCFSLGSKNECGDAKILESPVRSSPSNRSSKV